jgi:hypothetical protein
MDCAPHGKHLHVVTWHPCRQQPARAYQSFGLPRSRSAISCLLFRSRSISGGVRARKPTDPPSIWINKAVDGVTDPGLRSGAEIMPHPTCAVVSSARPTWPTRGRLSPPQPFRASLTQPRSPIARTSTSHISRTALPMSAIQFEKRPTTGAPTDPPNPHHHRNRPPPTPPEPVRLTRRTRPTTMDSAIRSRQPSLFG